MLLVAAIHLVACSRLPSGPLTLRGGAEDPSALALTSVNAQPTLSDCLAEYTRGLDTFMDTFDVLLNKASSDCKRSAFLGFKASSSRVRQRADLLVLQHRADALADLPGPETVVLGC